MSDIATAELMGVMRKAREEALSGSFAPGEVAVRCLERIRGIRRRHEIAGASDAEIDEAIARFRECGRGVTEAN